MEDRTTMTTQTSGRKSKLYCNRCGNFDLTKLKRGFVARYIFDEPRRLHCESCDTQLSYRVIASNQPLTPPSLYTRSDSTVLSNDKLGRPIYVTMDEYITSSQNVVISQNQRWPLFWSGAMGGLVLFGALASLYLVSPYSKPNLAKKNVYVEPIMRLGDVEILRLDNTKNKNSDIKVVLLDEPKKSASERVWQGVNKKVEGLAANKPAQQVIQPVSKIQSDLDKLLGN